MQDQTIPLGNRDPQEMSVASREPSAQAMFQPLPWTTNPMPPDERYIFIPPAVSIPLPTVHRRDHWTRGGNTTDHRTRGGNTTDHRTMLGNITDHRTTEGNITDPRTMEGNITDPRTTEGNITNHMTAGGSSTYHITNGGNRPDHITNGGNSTDHNTLARNRKRFRAWFCFFSNGSRQHAD